MTGEQYIEEILHLAHEMGIFSRTMEIANQLMSGNRNMDRTLCFDRAFLQAKKEKEMNEIYRERHTGSEEIGKNGGERS